VDGDTVTLVYINLKSGVPWQFGPTWPGQHCRARTRRGTACQKPALKGKTRCQLHGGKATGTRTIAGLQRLSAAQLRHGKYTKTGLAKAKYRAETGRRVLANLRRIEQQIQAAGLMPVND